MWIGCCRKRAQSEPEKHSNNQNLRIAKLAICDVIGTVLLQKELEQGQVFKLKARGPSVRTELIAGMTTFFSMVYILMVNANMFADPFGNGANPLGVSYGAIYIATAISAIVGTLYAACGRANLLDEKGEPLNMNEGMLSDAIATTVGAICGTSTVTTFSEVNAGVAAGGRTGLTSVFCGLFFFVAMFLRPIAQLIPSCATAAALIYVGLLMMGAIRKIDWDNFKIVVSGFLTLAIMPFTYNISYGIAFGLISYIVISIFCGDAKKSKGSTWVISSLFVLMLLLTH